MLQQLRSLQRPLYGQLEARNQQVHEDAYGDVDLFTNQSDVVVDHTTKRENHASKGITGHKGFGGLPLTLLDSATAEVLSSSHNKTSEDNMWASPWGSSPSAPERAPFSHVPPALERVQTGHMARDEASIRPPWNTTEKDKATTEAHLTVPQDSLSASQLRASSGSNKNAQITSTVGSRAGGGGGSNQSDDRDLVSQLMWENSSLLRRVEVQANALIEMSVEKERYACAYVHIHINTHTHMNTENQMCIRKNHVCLPLCMYVCKLRFRH
jgi:hypothetical protein